MNSKEPEQEAHHRDAQASPLRIDHEIPQLKHQEMIWYTTNPLNAGLPSYKQRQNFVTPNTSFFIRNHAPIPAIDVKDYRLHITGMVREPLIMSLNELQTRFKPQTITATLICAGYRRDELEAVAPIPNEVPWQADSISTAVWRGVSLQDVLQFAGVQPGAAHVAFLGLDEMTYEGRSTRFGASIPIDKALSSEVLLAYEMNGVPLPPEHGYPLRAVVPGYIGARSVKWLEMITVQAKPSSNPYQFKTYRLFPPHVQPENVEDVQGEMLGEYPMNAVICDPAHQDRLTAGFNLMCGLANGKGGRKVERVEVSYDRGVTWTQAEIVQRADWSWCFWEIGLDLFPGTYQLMVRAIDEAGHSQPEVIASVWNFKGYVNNAWHRIEVQVVDDE